MHGVEGVASFSPIVYGAGAHQRGVLGISGLIFEEVGCRPEHS
jgi:hypothetical protein